MRGSGPGSHFKRRQILKAIRAARGNKEKLVTEKENDGPGQYAKREEASIVDFARQELASLKAVIDKTWRS